MHPHINATGKGNLASVFLKSIGEAHDEDSKGVGNAVYYHVTDEARHYYHPAITTIQGGGNIRFGGSLVVMTFPLGS